MPRRSHKTARRATSQSATKGDLLALRKELKGDMRDLRTASKRDMEDLRTELKGDMEHLRVELRTELKGDMEHWKDEIIGEFHIVAGQIRHDLIGATKDDLSLLKDTDRKHDARISRLERNAELIAA